MPSEKTKFMQAIKKYFFDGTSAQDFMKEWKLLTDEDREQLGTGILDGSYDY